MGSVHLKAAMEVSGVELAAVCDPAVDPGTAVALPCPLVDFEALIASPGIDALVIATPTSLHEAMVARGLEQGKHVLCEKPLTLNPATDQALAQQAADVKRILQVGFWRRFAEPYLRVRDILAAGRIGAPRGIRAVQWDAVPPPSSFCDPRISGGIEIDCGVHEFDLVRWLFEDEVEAVAACSAVSSTLAAVGDVDTLYGLARLSGGCAMAIDLTRCAGYRDSIRTEVIGAHGSVVADFSMTGTLTVQWYDRREVIPFTSQDVMMDAVCAQLRAFAGAVRTGQADASAADARDSCRALIAAEALRRARGTERWWAVSTCTTSVTPHA
jgi:scyllo-inositol 2-dehydrogenase (NAD+)